MADFVEVYDLYFRDVYRFAFSLCRNELIAEEITQETFYKALTKLDQFDDKCKITVWLCQIAKNTYISMCRKNKQIERLSEFNTQMNCDSIEDIYCQKESSDAIRQAIHTLDEPFGEVFSLRMFGDLTYKQIGTLFGKTETWARVTYHRAKLKIKEVLK